MGSTDHSSRNDSPESPHTECLSSNATLFYRVFIPIFGTVFLSGLTLAMMLIPGEDLYLPFPVLYARLGAITILAGWIYLIRSTIWRLKRADASEEHLYISNYWHTVRYPWNDVENITESKRIGRRLVHFHLKAPGRFGQTVTILAASHYDELMKNLNVRNF